jgi:hypothetical protein
MNRKVKHHRDEAGMALVVVMSFVTLLGSIAIGLQFVTGSHLKMTRINTDSEKAFYVAEAGVEQAAQYVAQGSNVPAAFVGLFGDGAYVATVISGASITDSWHTVGGQININPNNSAQHEFTVTMADGSTITRDTLTQDYPGFTGNPVMVHVKPKGNQNGLLVDGVTYELSNSDAYDIVSDYMSACIYNDNVNTNNGKAMGKWWISVAAAEANIAVNGMGSGSGNIGQSRIQYSILSVGTVRGRSKVVMRETLRQKTWAEYAMWMNANNGIYFIAGEKFYGKVHSNDPLGFSGNPEFFDTCTSSANSYVGSIAQCIFHNGFTRNAAEQTLQTVDFARLKSKATLTLEGLTYLTFNGTNLLITNSRQGWTLQAVSCTAPQVIYVKTSATGSSATKPGDCNLGGTLNGRVTVVCERDAYITNHIVYASDSKTNMLSDDALGIITKRDIAVTTAAPSNLKIYAHMMATGQYDASSTTDGSFGVVNYSVNNPRGMLMVHGGIIQDDRGAVGTFDSGTGQTTHGFYKNYTYDVRFKIDPPPEYPPLGDQLVFGTWRER